MVSTPDLLYVVDHWGACVGGSGEAPKTVEDCYDYCMGEFNTEPAFYECFDACIESLCQQGLLEGCQPDS